MPGVVPCGHGPCNLGKEGVIDKEVVHDKGRVERASGKGQAWRREKDVVRPVDAPKVGLSAVSKMEMGIVFGTGCFGVMFNRWQFAIIDKLNC